MLRTNKSIINVISRKDLQKNIMLVCQHSQKSGDSNNESKRMAEFRKKLRETTSIDDLGDQPNRHPQLKDDPLPAFPDNTNPETGEVGGPRGPEPTRFGDWERKGRVSDF